MDIRAWVLLGVLVAWQLPHFMAIAYMYREQYEAAGYKMITVTDRSGVGAGLHAILGSVLLIVFAVMAIPPVSLVGAALCILAVAVSVWQLAAAIRFVRSPELYNQLAIRMSSIVMGKCSRLTCNMRRAV